MRTGKRRGRRSSAISEPRQSEAFEPVGSEASELFGYSVFGYSVRKIVRLGRLGTLEPNH
jgi:hypothetical protein